MRSHTGAWWSRLTRVASNDWNRSAWVQDATLFLACLVTYSALHYMHINQLSMCLPILIYCTSTITSYVLFPIWPYACCLVYIRTKRIPIQRYTRSMLLGTKVLNPQHNSLYRKCQSSQCKCAEVSLLLLIRVSFIERFHYIYNTYVGTASENEDVAMLYSCCMQNVSSCCTLNWSGT